MLPPDVRPALRALRRLSALLPLCLLLSAAPALGDGAPPPPPRPKPPRPPDWIARYLSSQGISAPRCTTPVISQPFSAWKDFAYYALAPGQSTSKFTGVGWMLLNGAAVARATLPNGTSGQVLRLPAGSLAISPPMCVTAAYPKARTMIRNLLGGGGVAFFVTYAGTSTWGKARNGGNAHGPKNQWALSGPINLQPSHTPGWQIVRFALVPSGGSSQFQIFNFYVDPYAKG